MLWEMPDPSNGTCFTYAGEGTRTSFSKARPHDPHPCLRSLRSTTRTAHA
jgi:hypothetical protein